MTHLFPSRYSGHVNRVGHQKVTFEIDDSQAELIKELSILPVGSPVFIVVYEIEKGDANLEDIKNSKDEMRNRLIKRLYARMRTYETEAGVPEGTVKKLLKAKLIYNKIIEKSLSELDESKAAHSIYILETQLNPSNFDYEHYK